MRRLIIGNKAYSSWSMRAWLAVHHAGLKAEDVLIPLYEEGSAERIRSFSPTGKVPCLMDSAVAIWDSLAVCEYVAELKPDAGLLPDDAIARAVCRSAVAEMHGGFPVLRKSMPMNVRKKLPGRGRPEDPAEAEKLDAEIARLERLWETCRTDYGAGGPFLFGRFTLADCFYAPVVTRLRTYGVTLGPMAEAYMDAIMDHALVRRWIEEADAEPWILPHVEK